MPFMWKGKRKRNLKKMALENDNHAILLFKITNSEKHTPDILS